MSQTPSPPSRSRITPTWPTRLGVVFTLLVLGIGLMAITLSSNLLYLVVSVMLAFLSVSGLLAEYTVSGLKLAMEIRGEVFANRPTGVSVSLRNTKVGFPSFGLSIRDPRFAPFGPDRLRVVSLLPGEATTASFSAVFPRRGWHRLEGVWIATRFPFSLADKSAFFEAPIRVLVYPAPSPSPALLVPPDFPTNSGPHSSVSGNESVTGLRDYRPHDPFRLIHWKRSARTGTFRVKIREAESRSRLILLIDALPEAPLELAVSLAAGVLIDVNAQGLETVLASHAGVVGPGFGPTHLNQCLAHLALLEPGPVSWAPPPGIAQGDRAATFVVIHKDGRQPDWASSLPSLVSLSVASASARDAHMR